MKNFEQQTADAIRSLTVVCAILAVALLVAMGLAAWGLARSTSASGAVKAGLAEQTSNRTGNVAHWCSAINQLDTSLTAYVALFPRAPQLHLKRLDCGSLEAKTLASTTPH